MKRALITTTINVPRNLSQWAKSMTEDDIIIVAGDLKTPHRHVREFLDTLPVPYDYLHPEDHAFNRWKTNEVVGFNSVQRRNIALLEAIRRGPDVVITCDDDNYPVTDNWVERVTHLISRGVDGMPRVSSSNGWFNVGDLCHPQVTHRGYPMSVRHSDSFYPRTKHIGSVDVFASLWHGDPDIDAVERMCHDPVVSLVTESVILDTGTWCPFNSQATAYSGLLAPLMYMWPGVGRFDDIWCSYLARAVMDSLGYFVMYGHPSVRQERNQHNLVHDLKNELFGYEYTDQICNVLRAMIPNADPLLEPFALWSWFAEGIIESCRFLPTQTAEGLVVWYDDVRLALEEAKG